MCSVFTAVCRLCLWGLLAEIVWCLVDDGDQFDVVVVRPQRIRTQIESNENQEMFPDGLSYQLFFGGRNHTIHLQKNRQLIAHNYTEIYYGDDGPVVSRNPNVKVTLIKRGVRHTAELRTVMTLRGVMCMLVFSCRCVDVYQDGCYYHGHIEDVEDSSVSVGICSGIRGLVRLKEQMYAIRPVRDHSDGDHVMYKHLRQKRNTFTFTQPPAAASFKSSRWTRKRFNTPRYVELFLVVDNTEVRFEAFTECHLSAVVLQILSSLSQYQNFRSNVDTVRERMLEVINHVDKLYRPLNIRVVLVGLEVWSTQDQIVISVSSDDTLSRFVEWRKTSLLARVKHDNAQLVTGIDFLGDTVGLANRFAMCGENSAGVNQDHNENPLGLASTIAHEMGHNMGLSHDQEHCTCATHNSICLMTERVGKVFPDQFSDCSLEQMSVFLDNVNPVCLLSPPASDGLYGGTVRCGNDFLDAGEECDCGSVQDCNNPCCDAATCRLTEGSQCADGDCCDNCQMKSAGSLCRDSVNECDLVEYCTGLSHQCPPDDFHMNGMPCSSQEGYCYNGRCPTHLQHCHTLWGPGATVASDSCFYQNTFGRNDSHCGRTKDAYRACTKESMFCGKIFCVGGKEYPVTGQKAVISTLRGLCHIAGDGSESNNLSMVPTGTKCGHNKVCYDFTCQDMNVYGSDEGCSLKCSGRGICNQKNECHCDPGWAPPYCHLQYSQLPSRRVKTVGISVAAAVVFLLLVFAGLGGFYYKRRKAISHNEDLSSGQMNLLHDDRAVRRNPPHISEPVFIESSMTLLTRPTRAAPPPPPQPKQIKVTPGIKSTPPPVPPLKPSPAKRSFETDQETQCRWFPYNLPSFQENEPK
ncbi:zinc metalloproteinase-disintegrin-like EoMP06 isoform X5 [Triplophysa rosa]|uniref:zinc metalloproteinase-disintegrin-like EoMP06 isoform X5 n=1 Tax=Triplophysa rosa TaxID=992332 RepID=UPI0025463240|nr:zinc metalloproteinase-disintegrin-like EoMP06 isoform X5 [Triplophysa rosa]